MIRAFVARGHRVILVSPNGPERPALEAMGIEFVALSNLRRRGLNPLRDLALLLELAKIYRQHKVDWAFHFTIKPVIYGSLAARWVGVKNICTLTGLGYTFLSGKKTNSLVRKLYQMAIRKADLVLFHNPDDRALFVDDGLCSAEQSSVVGGSGIRLEDFPLSPYSEAEPGRFLFAGRLLTDKGIREYVAAARVLRNTHPHYRFHVVGQIDEGNPAGIIREELEEWIAEGVIVYGGAVADIRPHLRKASVVVLPSYREGCPRVMLEAAATGRALLGTDVPGVREIVIDKQTGLRVPVESTDELADGMVRLMEGAEFSLESLGLSGRRLVADKFSEEAVVGVYWAEVGKGQSLLS